MGAADVVLAALREYDEMKNVCPRDRLGRDVLLHLRLVRSGHDDEGEVPVDRSLQAQVLDLRTNQRQTTAAQKSHRMRPHVRPLLQ